MNGKTLRVAFLVASVSTLGATIFASAASADTTLTVGKASANADPIIPVNIGYKVGIFQKHGLNLKIVDFTGGGKMVQALTAGAIDIGDGAGTEMAYVAKGAPMIAICETASTFPFLGVGVPENSPAKSLADLKGKAIGVSTAGSLTEWLAKRLAVHEGWDAAAIKTVAIGNASAGIIAAFRAGQVDADMGEGALFLSMAENKSGHLLAPVTDFQGSAVSGALFASNKLVESNPDAIRALLAGYVETLDWIRAHKDETVKIKSELRNYSAAVEAKDYDITLGMYTKDCRFDAEGLATLKRSFTDLKLTETAPDMAKLYTEAYVP